MGNSSNEYHIKDIPDIILIFDNDEKFLLNTLSKYSKKVELNLITISFTNAIVFSDIQETIMCNKLKTVVENTLCHYFSTGENNNNQIIMTGNWNISLSYEMPGCNNGEIVYNLILKNEKETTR